MENMLLPNSNRQQQQRQGDERTGVFHALHNQSFSPEHRLLIRLMNVKRAHEVPTVVREYWRSDRVLGNNRARIVTLILLPILAAVASGIVAVALLVFSFVAQFILVPAIVTISFIGYGLSLFLGFTSVVLGGACIVVGSIAASCLLAFGIPLLILQLLSREKRQRTIGVLCTGLESFRKSFREALRNTDINSVAASARRDDFSLFQSNATDE